MIKTNLGCELDLDAHYYSLIVPYSLVESAQSLAPVSPGAMILIDLIQPASEHPKPPNAYCFKSQPSKPSFHFRGIGVV